MVDAMRSPEQQEEAIEGKYFYISLVLHGIILLALILGIDYTTPMPVIENTNQHDVISAVVLGDTPKSKIVPDQPAPPPPPTPVVMEKPKLRIRAEVPDELKPELNFQI